MKTTTREEKLGIKANRLKDHRGYFTELSNALGIGWPDNTEKFMGRDIQTWTRLYNSDEHLNNVSLKEFDACYPFHYMKFGKYGWSMSDTVSCLKTVIINKVLENQPKNKEEVK